MAIYNQNRILELDAMRGIAAISVVLFHFTMGNSFAFRQGGTGVDLFFIISGFVISLTLAKTNSWNDFAVNRLSRLYPTYWVVVSFTAIISIFSGIAVTFPQYLANLTMFQSYFNIDDIDWPYWTMMVEMIFYICMIILFTTKTLQHIEFLGLAFVALLIPVHSTYILTNYPGYHRALISWFPMVVYFPLFFSGIIFYRIKFMKPTVFRYVLIGLCFVVQFWMFRDGFRRTFTLTRLEYLIMLSIWYSLFLLYVNNKLGFLINRLTIFLGAISFSLYLVHQFIGLHILLPFLKLTLKLNNYVSITISLSIVILLAYIIQILIEKPSMNFIRKKYTLFKQNK